VIEDGVLLATTFLTRLAGFVVISGGLAGWWGAYVSARSERRLRAWLEAQVDDIGRVLDDDGSAG
jgi:hypothetical protein